MARCIVSRVGRDEANRLLTVKRRWFGQRERQRTKLECIYLPCQWVRAAREGEDRPFDLLVNGFGGCALAFGVEPLETAEGEGEFVYPLDEKVTLEIARKTLLDWALSRLFRPRNGKGELSLVLGERVHYPYWVRYEISHRGTVRFRLLDAVTGRMGRQEIRLGFLEALRRGLREKSSEDSE